MGTLTQARTKANNKLSEFWTQLQTAQDAYFAKHGKYFQLLATGGSEVTADEEYDFVKTSPSDEPDTADVNITFTSKLPCELRVHEWVGPNGNGYRAIVRVTHNGRTFTRSRDSEQNDTGWLEITDEI